jgi:GR25 family glycosyltransferase involved in LPS biosynthesis
MALVRLVLVLLFCVGTTVLVRLVAFKSYENQLYAVLSRIGAADVRSDTLSVAVQIFVLSLARRTDRREQMERLRRALGARWDYVDATEASDEKVNNILGHVRWQRAQQLQGDDFRWPDGIDSLVASDDLLQPTGSDLWATSGIPDDWEPSQAIDAGPTPLLCATDNDTVIPYVSDLPEYRILSPAKLACWYSHWSLIRRIANGKEPGTTIILEDDIDMEKDIRERLGSVWALLPAGWDIVFLGRRVFFCNSHLRRVP